MIGRHSTIDRPDSVSRVSAPSTIMKKIMPATTISQLRIGGGGGLHARRTMREANAPVSILNVANARGFAARAKRFLRAAAFVNRFAYERITPPAIRISDNERAGAGATASASTTFTTATGSRASMRRSWRG